jgi:Trk K+ transport system NAD-binding subunit
VDRFLAGHGAKKLRIVILAEKVDEELRQRLRERLGRKAVERTVLLRTGTPLRVDHLERVAYRDAAVVILPGAGFGERDPGLVDSMVIKTLASVSGFAGESGSDPPDAVAQIFDGRRVDVANRAYGGNSEVVATDALVSRLVAQCVRHRGLWSVMSGLFTHSEDNSIYVRPVEGRAGNRFCDLRGRYSSAVLLGYVRPALRRPVLNPAPDTVLEEGDRLVFLARRYRDCVEGRDGVADLPSVDTEQLLRQPTDGTRRLLILGWSRKVPALLRELAKFRDDAFEIDIVSRMSVEEREAGITRYDSPISGMAVRQIEARLNMPGALEKLQPENYDHIIILASEMLAEKEHADAVSVVAALTLRGIFTGNSQKPGVIVELLDEENRHLFRGGDEDVMVSPEVVSYVVSQTALRRELAWIFWELTRPWGGQIVLREAGSYIDGDGPVTFLDAQRAAAKRSEIALGFRRPDGNVLQLNPDRDSEWTVGPGDEVVVLTSISEPDGVKRPGG